MKPQILTATITIMAILLVSTLFIDAGNASTQASFTIQSSGTISAPNNQTNSTDLIVILRNICITDLNPNQNLTLWVDNFVSNHPHITAVTLSDMHQYGIWWYGYSFSNTSGTWMGWTYEQLKTMIDRFHYNGWKVGLETTGIAWNNQQEYNYITQLHPELSFTNANGQSAATTRAGTNKLIPNFFANFTTADTANNISSGTRLIDLYTNRLTQMITEGLEWDFWFGTDGWNGISNQEYYWNRPIASQCYSFSIQDENEYGNWTGAILPQTWENMTQTQKANAIISNSTILNTWWYYWQIRFAQMYAQIKQAFADAGLPSDTFRVIGSADDSSAPNNCGLSPGGMYNMSLLAAYNSVDYIYVDQEWATPASTIGQNQAYAGGLVKMQSPMLTPIIGLQPQDCLGNNYSLSAIEQSYLDQAVNYVWYNGVRYRVSSPNIIMLQYSFGSLTQQEVENLFALIQSTANLLDNAEVNWLGPVYATPSAISGAMGNAWYNFNYSFSQWAWTANLQNNPQFINSAMGTILIDESLQDTGPNLAGLNNIMINKWATGNLNIWYWENSGRDWGISSVWAPSGACYNSVIETQANNAFHITYSYGSTSNYTILSNLNDKLGSKISPTFGATTYSLSSFGSQYYVHGVYVPAEGFTTIAAFTNDSPNRIGIGYYKNATTGTFLLSHMAKVLPSGIVNELLYFVSDCPITTSEPLLDLKVLNSGQKLVIPMTNQKNTNNVAISSTLSINATRLSLGDPSNYMIYWASSNATVPFSSWEEVPITLAGTDCLVIAPV